MTPSQYQMAIYDFVTGGAGHGSVNAVAGSGKTTTGIEAIRKFAKHLEGTFMSFGKAISLEIGERLRESGIHNCVSGTYNSFGWNIALKNMVKKPRLNKDKTQNILRYEIFNNLKNDTDMKRYYKIRYPTMRLVDLLKNMNVHDLDTAAAQIPYIIDRYDIEEPEDQSFQDIVVETFGKSIGNDRVFDFNDQKYMVLHLGLPIPQHDFLLIDEFQDTCDVESALIFGACEQGRIIIFGDPDQNIFSFKGTTVGSMDVFERTFKAKQLPLSISYRCPRLVVAEAKKIVPRIEAAPTAIDGIVEHISKAQYYSQVQPADLVLARTTVDIVSSCMGFLRSGREAYVEGKEVEEQLEAFIDLISNHDDSMAADVFFHKLNAYEIKKTDQLTKFDRETQLINLQDKCETLRVLLEDCDKVYNLKKTLSRLFQAKDKAIRHMTIHKSKGLQGGKNNDVYILRKDKIPHPRCKKDWMIEEEYRLLYVAQTRTQRGLYYVAKDPYEK